MRACQQCGSPIRLGRIYCPGCGAKLEFVDEKITESAVEERKTEKLSNVKEQLLQWIALLAVLLSISYCFRDYARRMPEADAPPFLFGPAATGGETGSEPLVIGKDKGMLELGKRATDVPLVRRLPRPRTTPQQKERGEQLVKVLSGEGTRTITLKDGRTLHGIVLGRTRTHLTVSVGNKVETVAVPDISTLR